MVIQNYKTSDIEKNKKLSSNFFTVYANNLLVSVDGDPNNHGAGNLSAGCNEVYVNGILVVNVGDGAGADGLCVPVGGAHCGPSATGGSPDVFVGD